MRKIKIFVAGSKDLSRERDAIKILANDLNSRYNAEDVMIIIHSYEHFNDNQDDYNRFIENEADIVVFILDGSIGDKTEEEFMKATASFNNFHRPEVIVFLKEFNEISGDIGRIQGLISGRLGNRYYVDYSGLPDLRSKARERITRFIDNLPPKPKPNQGDNASQPSETKKDANRESSPERPIRKKSPSFNFNSLSFIFLGLVVVLAGLLLWGFLRTEDDIMIFTGGGSVKNFLMKESRVDVTKYPHSIYTNLASGTAWDMLMEEANRYQEEADEDKSGFTTICLSAADIDSAYFVNEKTKGMFNNSRIIRYRAGTDDLTVYVHNDIIKDHNFGNITGEITVDSLRALIRYAVDNPHKLRLFTTSRNSGTLRGYQALLLPSDSIDLNNLLENKRSYLFYQNSSSAYLNVLDQVGESLPYVILGSNYYGPNKLDQDKPAKYTRLTVIQNNEPVSKPINVYFLGFLTNQSQDNLKVKREVVDFLEKIGAEKRLDSDTWNYLKKGRVSAGSGRLILNLN